MRLDDAGWFRFEAVRNKDTTIDFPVIVEFNGANLRKIGFTLIQTRIEDPYMETLISCLVRKYERTQMQRGLRLL